MKFMIPILLSFFSITPLFGQEDSIQIEILKAIISQDQDSSVQIEDKKYNEIEINELIVNETMTKAGNDFHELFYNRWVWPDELNDSFIMVIKEKPLRGISTQVSIFINDMLIFEMPLQPRFDYLESIAMMAIDQANGYVSNYEEIQKALGGEDVQGTGIF